jgi:hypothetical protein
MDSHYITIRNNSFVAGDVYRTSPSGSIGEGGTEGGDGFPGTRDGGNGGKGGDGGFGAGGLGGLNPADGSRAPSGRSAKKVQL